MFKKPASTRKNKRSPIEYAIRSLSSKPQTEDQIKKKLEQYYPDVDHDAVLTRLKDLNYINDADFVDRWLKYRSTGSVKGKFMLRHELKQKGINADLLDEKMSTVCEEDLITTLIEQRWPRIKGDNIRARKQKLAGFLASRGFSSSKIWDALEKVGGEDQMVE